MERQGSGGAEIYLAIYKPILMHEAYLLAWQRKQLSKRRGSEAGRQAGEKTRAHQLKPGKIKDKLQGMFREIYYKTKICSTIKTSKAKRRRLVSI